MPNAGAAALKEAGVRKMQKLSSEIESFVAFLLRARRWDGTPIALSSVIIVKFLLSIFTLTSWNRGNALELFVSCHHHELYEPASYATYLGKRERKAAKRTRSLDSHNAAFGRVPIVALTAMKGDRENCRKARRSHQTGDA
jgi:hypothetical protein